jgi:hypothetical protein
MHKAFAKASLAVADSEVGDARGIISGGGNIMENSATSPSEIRRTIFGEGRTSVVSIR